LSLGWASTAAKCVSPGITAELVTGWGKHRDTWQTGDAKHAVAQALVEMGVPLDPKGRNPGRLAIDCAAWMQQSRE
jgi:hypothetical protein